MPDVTTSSKEIHERIEEIVARSNEQIRFLNSMPDEFRAQMNMQVYDDLEYLLRYINALHNMLADSVPKEIADGGAFKF